MQTHSLDEISVGQITDVATVNRATFYDHYTDKFALFEALISGGFHQLLEERQVVFDGTCPSALKTMILAVCDYLSQAHSASVACERQSAFEPLFEAAVTKSIFRVLLPGIPLSKATLAPNIIASATSSALFGACKAWSQTRDREPREKFAQRLSPLLASLMSAER